MSLENFEENFDDLILSGHIEFSGVNSSGEILYSFTDKFLKEHNAVAKRMNETIYADVYALWVNGFVNMNPLSANPVIKITEKALDMEAVSKLPQYYQDFLEQIKSYTRIQDQ